MRPTAGYAPRCACCVLLFCAHSHGLAGLPEPAESPQVFPEAHRVRLDVATGVCVFTEELGGVRPGSGHDLAIEAVDEAMPEELFDTAQPRR